MLVFNNPYLDHFMWKQATYYYKPLKNWYINEVGFLYNIKTKKFKFGRDNNIKKNDRHQRITIKHKSYYVHRIVAEAFVKNPNQYPEVNHIDENRANNNADNLEWCTSKYNKNYGQRAEKFGRKRGIPVICLETGEEYYSCGEAERKTGIRRTDIHSCCTKYRNAQSAGGFHWAFAKDVREARADWTG